MLAETIAEKTGWKRNPDGQHSRPALMWVVAQVNVDNYRNPDPDTYISPCRDCPFRDDFRECGFDPKGELAGNLKRNLLISDGDQVICPDPNKDGVILTVATNPNSRIVQLWDKFDKRAGKLIV